MWTDAPAERLAFGTYDAMRAYGGMLRHMREFSEKMPMQKERFVYALSVKLRMKVNLFDMCFVRVRANHEPAKNDVKECCESFDATQAELGVMKQRRNNSDEDEDIQGRETQECGRRPFTFTSTCKDHLTIF